MTKDSLGDRMKKFYEDRNRTYLARRTPVIIRVDGKAFHSLTAKAIKPFDLGFIADMALAAQRTAKELQGFKLGYVQSDEVSFLLTDYDQLDTDAWFDYNVQKICSVTASYMTYYFNTGFQVRSNEMRKEHQLKGIAVFDARCFNIPREEIANYFLWRAKDWERNSVSMLAQANFSHKELHGKGRADMHEMLHQKNLNWAHQPAVCRNGTFFGPGWEDDGILPTYERISNLVEAAGEVKDES